MTNNIYFYTLLLLTFFIQQNTFAQEAVDATLIQNKLWADDSPQTLKKGRKVWPLLGVKKMGAGKNMEWHIQPVFFFISPNLGLKKHWKTKDNGWSISSFHQINYPSIYLNLFSREGAGGVLPKDSQIPPMLSIKNEVLVGINHQGSAITFRAGLATAFKLGSAEKRFPDIDFPFLYNRTLGLNNSPNLYTGLNFNRDLRPKLNIEADFTAFSVGNEDNDFVFESQLIFFWKKSDRFGLKLGAAAAHGRYPYGNDFRMIPVFDVLFGFGNRKEEF